MTIHKCGVYQIRNRTNDKVYIGSSVDISHRFVIHRSYLRQRKHTNVHLQRSWDKHGENCFVLETLIYCHPDMCLLYEQKFLDQWEPDYNILKIAGSCRGRRLTDEHKARISKSLKLHKRTDEHKANISKAGKGKKMRPLSKEHKASISAANRGRKHSDEAKAKISKGLTGRKLTTEHKANVSKGLKVSYIRRKNEQEV